MTGTVIGVGIDNKEIIETIDKNNKILVCDLLNSININGINKSNKKIKMRLCHREIRSQHCDTAL